MGKHTLLLVVTALVGGGVFADTLFNATVDNDFNNTANWTNGIPAKGTNPGEAVVGADATMTGNYEMKTSIDWWLRVNATLNTGAYELQLRSGSAGKNTYVEDGGVLNIQNGGLLDIAGTGADLFIAQSGTGTVNVENGGTLAASKAIDVSNGGLLYLQSGAIHGGMGDELQLRTGSTLKMGLNTAGDVATMSVGGQVRLGNATLELNLEDDVGVGDSWTLINTSGGFYNYNGALSNFTFSAVNVTGVALDVGESIELNYGANTLTATVIPEPAALGMVAAFGAGILFVRRRFQL
jgi:hypothetical protein